LSADESIIYIHVDLKINISIFEGYQNLPNVIFIKNRVNVNWGAYSMVQCVVNSFKEILPHFNSSQYISLISGQDYPLMSNEAMNLFLSKNQGKIFMEFYSIYSDWEEAIPRLEKFHLTNYAFPGNSMIESIMNRVLPKRVPPKDLIYVGKSQWFTITIEHVAYILDYLETHPHIKRFFSFTWGSDEIIFQSILYTSKYKEHMINNNLRFIDWSLGGASPKILTVKDVDHFSKSGKFFARKFDENIDSKVLDWIDANLLTQIML
jgi:hypothetical protein